MNPEIPDDNSISGVEPEPREPSLREIAEAAYDEGSTPDDDAGPSNRGDGRDDRGRFVAKEQSQTGEAEPKAPSPDKPPLEAQDRPDPAAPPRDSNQPPEHWSAEDKATFAKLPQEARDFLMRRHGEMEADFTRKSQANAQAVQAVTALQPIFQDADIARSMQESNLQPLQAIYDWARLHKGAVSADSRTRAAVLYEICERMGFDPARVFAQNRQVDNSVPETLRNDPTFKYVANLTDRTTSDLQALRSEIQQFKQQESARLESEAIRVTRGSIDSFADEKGQDGRPLRPYFDTVLPYIVDVFKLNPNADLAQTYEQACWAHPEIRKHLIDAERSRVNQQHSNQRASQAARSNVRGLTSPVAKPSQERKGNGTLRDTLESSADEVGF